MIADFEGEVVDPAALAAHLAATPGLVEHGLFAPALVADILIDDAQRLRSRILRLFEAAGHGPRDDEPRVSRSRRHRGAGTRRRPRWALLSAFSNTAHDYAAKVLRRKGLQLHMGVAVSEVAPDHVKLADGTTIQTRCVVWGGGLRAAPVAADPACAGSGGRIDVRPGAGAGSVNRPPRGSRCGTAARAASPAPCAERVAHQ